MSVTEIKEAIKELSPAEVTELASFFHEIDNDAWDRQMEADAASGKLQSLIQQAELARGQGTLRNWPTSS